MAATGPADDVDDMMAVEPARAPGAAPAAAPATLPQPASRLYTDLPPERAPPAGTTSTAAARKRPLPGGAPAAPAKKARVAPAGDSDAGEDKLAQVLGRLGPLLQAGSAEAKFAKALPVLARALDALGPDTAAAFVPALRAAQSDAARAVAEPTRKLVLQIFDAVQQHRADFGGDMQLELDRWFLRCLTCNRMQVDDSFKFSAAVRGLEAAIDSTDQLGPVDAQALWPVILQALAIGVDMYKFQWARPPVDVVVARIVDRRHKLLPEHRDAFDALGDQVRARKRPTLAVAPKKFKNLT